MRTTTLNIYTFEELSEKAQAKVISDHLNVLTDYDWWSDTATEDAESTAGLEIEEFDLYPRHIRSKFITTAKDSALKVVSEHGESCATYAIAKKFLNSLEQSELTETEIEELEDAYLKDLSREYLNMLDREYEYLTSDEAIRDFIEGNDWEFYEDGRRYKS